MKFNWVNLLATLLIAGGIALLVQRHFRPHPTRHIPTVDEAKADIEKQVETKLGRPLSEAEVDMIEVNKSGDNINISLHQPLYGRLLQAIHNAKAATNPSLLSLPTPVSDLTAPSLPTIGSETYGAKAFPTTGVP